MNKDVKWTVLRDGRVLVGYVRAADVDVALSKARLRYGYNVFVSTLEQYSRVPDRPDPLPEVAEGVVHYPPPEVAA